MSKHNNKKSRLKYVFLAFTCATAFTFSGMAAACGNNDSSDEEKEKTTSKEDTQLLKNGNFEFFTVPEKKENGNEPEYLIKSVENWSHGGTNSSAMSGIISTSKTAWEKMTDKDLADKLDYNNKLDASSSDYLENYIDYNGMTAKDILYKNQFDALKADDDLTDEDKANEHRKDTIENPGTHYGVKETNGSLVTADGKKVYENDKGEYFLKYDDKKDEYSEPISNVLMLHNYATSHNGIAQNYSSVEIELPANTAAEISVWVKTSYLKFSKGTTVSQDRGANITVTQTVGSSSLDKFMISCINTEKLVKEGAENYNGWVEYTVYVNACDFASSKIKLELGLGETGYLTEGYAFFDDVSVTKYISLDDSESYKANESKLNDKNSCNLSSDASEKIYKADSYERVTATGEKTDARNSKDFHYLLDLASEHGEGNKYKALSFAAVDSLKTGYTVDDDNYVCSDTELTQKNLIGFGTASLNKNENNKWHKPFNSSIDTSKDLLAYVDAGHTFTSTETEYYEKLNKALNSAADLPKNSAEYHNNMLVMLSAYGAAYTTSFELSVPREGYQIVSFWVKTSDLGGSTAATVSIKTNDDNESKFTLDTTDKVTDIGDKEEEKDIFDGWVQCFFFVKNELETDGDKTSDKFTVEVSFGNTTIKGTEVHSYKNGWLALANMQTLAVNEDIFSYTSSGDTTASLTISEETEKKTQVFDEVYANQSSGIKNDAVIPSSYKGVNGGSSAVAETGHVSIPFDEFNNNKNKNGKSFTGLINKENFISENSAYNNSDWYQNLLNKFKPNGIDALDNWNKIFGKTSVQPLIINNTTRTSYVIEKKPDQTVLSNYFIKNDDGEFEKVAENAKYDEKETYYSLREVLNYGYIGGNKDVAADSYATVSVRVKVSENAVAYVYLVDTAAGKKVLSYTAPSYSFYYDAEGNVLKAEPKTNATNKEQRENILYTLRDDGLYEDEEGKLYANIYNYKKLYYENITYYDGINPATANKYTIDDLKDGVTYYDENGNKANHYLVTDKGIKVYQYINEKYYYIVEGKTQNEEITPFDTKFARYDFSGISEDYMVEINGADHANEWVTVTFVLHAGSEAKSYRLELWSGKREETKTAGNEENGIVIFDYSYTNVSDDEAKGNYEQFIIDSYLEILPDEALEGIETTGKNIKYFEDLADKYKDKIDADKLKAIQDSYKAHYYTYSLYDSPDFQPFNQEVASDGATGYDYNVADQKESLAYLQIKDGNDYTVFADYSATDKTITLNNPDEDDSTDDAEEETDNSSDGSIWLLASSIILVIALVFAIIAIFLKDIIKKSRRNKVTSKNNYDQRKANRYKRKLHINNEEIVEVDNTAKDDADIKTVEATPVEETENGDAAEEAPVEETESTPVEADVEETADVEDTPTEGTDDDGKQE